MNSLIATLLAAGAAALAVFSASSGVMIVAAAPVAVVVTLLFRPRPVDDQDPDGMLDAPSETPYDARISAKAMISAAAATALGGALLTLSGLMAGSPAQLACLSAAGGAVGIWAASMIRRSVVGRCELKSDEPIRESAPFPDGEAAVSLIKPAPHAHRITAFFSAVIAGSLRVLTSGMTASTGSVGSFGILSPTLIGAGFFAGTKTVFYIGVGAAISAAIYFLRVIQGGSASSAEAGIDSFVDLMDWIGEIVFIAIAYPYRVGIGILLGSALVATARASYHTWIALRGGKDPFRVRFEIGGLGTRIEDMTIASDRGMDATRLRALGLAAGALFYFSVPGAGGFSEHITLTVIVMIGSVAVATMASRLVGIVGAASGAILFLSITIVGVIRDGHTLPWFFPSLAALLVAGFVAAELAQDHRVASVFRAAPWRSEGFALLGVLLGAFVLWIVIRSNGLASSDVPGPPQILAQRDLFTNLRLSKQPEVWLGLVIGLFAEFRWRRGFATGIGAILPMGWAVPILVGGFIRWQTENKSLISHGAAGLMIGDALALSALVWVL